MDAALRVFAVGGSGDLGLTEAGVLRYNRAVVGAKFGARFGAWPSGKAPGFGPGIAGSNPAAPAGGVRGASSYREIVGE